MKERALHILWPAFLVAGVLEMMVFAVMDPGEMRWFGGPLLDWPPLAVYSVTFLIFWVGVAVAGVLSAVLALSADEVNRLGATREGGPDAPSPRAGRDGLR